jgi:hypothetical protein
VHRDVEVAGASLGSGRVINVRLGWQSTDPLAVTVDVTAQPEHPSLPRGSWVVLRDFLRYGLEEPTGDGDVRILPDLRGGLVLELRQGQRCSRLVLPSVPVREFLDETEQIVPAGEEAGAAELDALIARLLEY